MTFAQTVYVNNAVVENAEDERGLTRVTTDDGSHIWTPYLRDYIPENRNIFPYMEMQDSLHVYRSGGTFECGEFLRAHDRCHLTQQGEMKNRFTWDENDAKELAEKESDPDILGYYVCQCWGNSYVVRVANRDIEE